MVIALTLTGFMYSDFSAANVFQEKVKAKAKSHVQQKRIKVNPVTDTEDAWTANIETNVYPSGTFENITVGYSAASGWDFSVALLNTQVLGNNKLFQGNTFFNIAKTFEITDDFSITVGSQNGVALTNLHPQLWYSFTFLDNRYAITPWLSTHAGPYLANAALTGTSRQIGFLAGVELTVIQNKLSIQMDYLSGHHSLSGATINALFNMTPQWQIYMGVSIPEENSGNEFAGIMGFNFSTNSL